MEEIISPINSEFGMYRCIFALSICIEERAIEEHGSGLSRASELDSYVRARKEMREMSRSLRRRSQSRSPKRRSQSPIRKRRGLVERVAESRESREGEMQRK